MTWLIIHIFGSVSNKHFFAELVVSLSYMVGTYIWNKEYLPRYVKSAVQG